MQGGNTSATLKLFYARIKAEGLPEPPVEGYWGVGLPSAALNINPTGNQERN